MPTRRIRSPCCARAASGQAAAPPARARRKSRRAIPFIPAHSASKTRVDALMPGIQEPRSVAVGPRNGVPATRASRGAPRGDERNGGAYCVKGGKGEHPQRIGTSRNDRAECGFEFAQVAGRKNGPSGIREIRKLEPELGGRLLRSLPLEGLTGMLRPGEHRNPPRLRQPLLEELDAFAHELDGEVAHAGEIAAGPGPALHELDVERIAAEAEHDGLRRLERPQPQDRELLRHDHLGIGCEEFAPHSFHIVQSRRPEAANRQIAAFAPTQLAQARAQRLQIGRGLVRALGPEPGNAPHALALLRTRRERPAGGCGGESQDEGAAPIKKMNSHGTTAEDVGATKKPKSTKRFTPFSSSRIGRKGRCVTHSITSSARPRSGIGTVRPSALAVLWWINSSTFVAC